MVRNVRRQASRCAVGRTRCVEGAARHHRLTAPTPKTSGAPDTGCAGRRCLAGFRSNSWWASNGRRAVDSLADVRNLIYSLYERRLAAALAGKPHPHHVGIMCDGNRRWAREMGYVDPNDGHRVGAAKIKDVLSWCDRAGIKHVTLYLLGTENLRRPAAELDPLLQIIEDLAGDLTETSQWE